MKSVAPLFPSADSMKVSESSVADSCYGELLMAFDGFRVNHDNSRRWPRDQRKIHSLMLSVIPIRYNNKSALLAIAVDMNERLARWNKDRKSAGLPEIEHRIGIHFGACVVGNIGGEQRVEFAIIGDAVNVASRICDAYKQFDTNFLISSSLDDRVQTDTRTEIVTDFEVRGRSEKLDLMKVY
mgnify:CR=1 FL=1